MRLIVEDVTKRFGDRTVLKGVSLVADARLGVGIVGPSGSGKSTLLGILGGVLQPDGGRVLIDVGGGPAPPGSFVFAWVTQIPAVLRQRPVMDNAVLAALGSGVGRDEAHRRATVLLRAVGLSGLAEVRARSLSGGEIQRLTIARAFAQDSAAVLADEPTGQLDRATTRAVIEAMWAASRATRRGLVVVTHDQEVAAQCERTIELVDGTAVSA